MQINFNPQWLRFDVVYYEFEETWEFSILARHEGEAFWYRGRNPDPSRAFAEAERNALTHRPLNGRVKPPRWSPSTFREPSRPLPLTGLNLESLDL